MNMTFEEQYLNHFNTQIIKSRLKHDRFIKRYRLGLKRWINWANGKSDCPHSDTKVCYRDDFAVGDIVCWKEFCNQCYKMVRSGIGQYVYDVPERTVHIDPKTRYDEGYYFSPLLTAKGSNESIR